MKKFLLWLSIVICFLASVAVGIYFLLPGAVLGMAKQAARWNAGVTSKEVVVGDHTWPYLEGGTGKTVLLLHGFSLDRDSWGGLLPALSEHYRVIAPDLPGFGANSRVVGADYGIASQAKRVHDFTRKLDLDEFFLIGFSMGGGISGYYASEHPMQVKGLVLIDAFGVDTPVESDVERLGKKGERSLIFNTVEGYDRTMALVFLTPPKIPGPLKKYIARIGAENYEFYGRIFETLGKGGLDILEPRLPKIKAGTLVIWGDRDRILDVSCAEKFRKGIKNCRVVIIPESGHVVYLEKPAESIAAVTGFLEELR